MEIILFRSNNIFASRVSKYLDYFNKKHINYIAVGWDRKCEGLQKENFDFLRYRADVNVGGFKAIINHCRWMSFVFRYLRKMKSVSCIHACDLNSAFPAALYKKFFSKNTVLIFDSCDWFSANFSKNRLLSVILEYMEKFTCNVADELILCEKERIEQITFTLKKAPLILPNIPSISSHHLDTTNNIYEFHNNWPTVAYFGGFSEDRFQRELLSLVNTEKFNLLIAGYGTREIELICENINQLENVKYIGKVDMKTGLTMCMAADVIYAMYCKVNKNNIYAAPNKYYEAMFLGKAIITTKGTILEKKVIDSNTGYVIDEDVNELKLLLNSITKDDAMKKGLNARLLWDKYYSTYVDSFFYNEYSSIIDRIS